MGDALMILRADARHLPIADNCVQCVVTSPPYFGLRSYAVEGNQIGSESTIGEYIAAMVQVFREVRRVLREDGVCFLNLGDSYATGTRAPRKATSTKGAHVPASWSNRSQPERCGTPSGFKTKDLMLIPHRVAIALQEDGWWIRNDIVWEKSQCMPESVTDRCTRSHEYVFHLTKSEKYFWNADAIKERAGEDTHARYARGRSDSHKFADGGPGGQTLARSMEHMANRSWKGSKFDDGKNLIIHPTVGKNRQPGVNPKAAEAGSGIRNNESFSAAVVEVVEFRNKRTVWRLGTAGYSGAHFATFTPAIPEICIRAGSRPGDLILDPFFGSGTVGMVAEQLGRKWIGCDLGYQDLQKKRVKNVQRQLVEVMA